MSTSVADVDTFTSAFAGWWFCCWSSSFTTTRATLQHTHTHTQVFFPTWSNVWYYNDRWKTNLMIVGWYNTAAKQYQPREREVKIKNKDRRKTGLWYSGIHPDRRLSATAGFTNAFRRRIQDQQPWPFLYTYILYTRL